MTALGVGITDRDPVTVHDWKPTHPVHEKPAYLVRAMDEEERAHREMIEAADRHEMGDINNPAPTMREMQRTMRIWNRACFRLEQARLRYTEEQRKYHEHQQADWEDEQQMYADLRRGG